MAIPDGATLAQDFAVGGFLAGLKMQGNQFICGIWDWINPFAAVVALGLVCGYVLLGATYWSIVLIVLATLATGLIALSAWTLT